MQRTLLAAVATLGVAGAGAAGLLNLYTGPAEGQPAAVAGGRLELALDEVRRRAEGGDAAAQYLLGQRHERGDGVVQDFVPAHLWYNLAATRGHPEATQARSRLSERMTAAQLARAQDLARQRLQGAAAAVPPATPAAAGPLTAADIELVQRRLNQLGYPAGQVDGRLGSRTRSALRAWQADQGLRVTGEITPEDVARLDLSQAPQTAGGPSIGADDVRAVQQRLNALGYSAGSPDGKPGARTRAAVRGFQQDAGLPPTGEIDRALLMALDGSGTRTAVAAERGDALRREVQKELALHGYWPDVDGAAPPAALNQAIRSYQQDAGLPPTGQASEDLLDHLRYARPEVLRQQAGAR